MSQGNTASVERFKRIAIVSWAIVGLAAVGYIALYILTRISVVIPLFVYMIALVYLLRPPVEFLNKKGVPRGLAVVITYLVVTIVIALILLYIVPIIINQAIGFAKQLPRIIQVVENYANRIVDFYQKRFGGTSLDIENSIQSILNQVKDINYSRLANRILGATAGFFSGIFNLILAPILAFFILKDLPRIKETMVNLASERHRLEFLEIIGKVNKVLSGFLKGQLIVASIVGFLATILFTVLGMPFSLLLGMISGITNIIPYFGPIIGGGIAIIVALFKSPLTALFVIIGMLAIQQFDSALISPLVMKRQVNLHPVLIVFALLIGGSLLGVLGLLLAVPTAAVSKVMVYHFIERADGYSKPS